MEVMNIKTKRVMILFIEAAEKMLRASGLAQRFDSKGSL